jgi:hypothetical protein
LTTLPLPSSNQASTPLEHAYIAYSFSPMLALEIVAATVYPISDA